MRDSAIRAGMLACLVGLAVAGQPTNNVRPRILRLEPPEKDFFSKSLDFQGIPIKAHEVVADEALYVAYDRLALRVQNLDISRNIDQENVAKLDSPSSLLFGTWSFWLASVLPTKLSA